MAPPERHILPRNLAELLLASPDDRSLRELVEHHLEVCAPCRDAYHEIELRSPECDPPEARSKEPTSRWVEEAIDAVEALAHEARTLFDELMALPAEERLSRIEAGGERFGNPVLVGLLIAESMRHVHSDARTALAAAECACNVAFRVPAGRVGEGWALASVARARAYRANAHRVFGNQICAGADLEKALGLYASLTSRDEPLEVEILGVAASCAIDLRLFARAREYLSTSRALNARHRNYRNLAVTLIQSARVELNAGEGSRAVCFVDQAFEVLHHVDDSELWLVATQAKAHSLLLSGRAEEARSVLEELFPIFRSRGQALAVARCLWLEAHILGVEGRLAEAESRYLEVQEVMSLKGILEDTAFLDLDLARLYARANRPEQARQRAEKACAQLTEPHHEELRVQALALLDELDRAEVPQLTN